MYGPCLGYTLDEKKWRKKNHLVASCCTCTYALCTSAYYVRTLSLPGTTWVIYYLGSPSSEQQVAVVVSGAACVRMSDQKGEITDEHKCFKTDMSLNYNKNMSIFFLTVSY